MKVKAVLNKFLTNKWVLNFVCIIALLNIIGLVSMGKVNELVYFVVFALLIRFFSKNMIIVLGVPVLLVSLLSYRNMVHEGMENNTTSKTETSVTETPKTETPKTESMENLEYKKLNKNSKQDPKTNQGLPITPLDNVATNSSAVSSDGAPTGESFEVGRGKRRIGSQIDYASTVEDAYDELNKILGSDGVKRLTDDTQRLMQQQMQLAESMKTMTPLIQGMAPMLETAKQMMKGLGDNKDGLGDVIQMAKNFTDKQL